MIVLTERRTEVLHAVRNGHTTIAAVAQATGRSVSDTDRVVRPMVDGGLLSATVPVSGHLPDDVSLALTAQGLVGVQSTGPEGVVALANLLSGWGTPAAPPPDPDLLVSDSERDAAAAIIAQAYADNRIDQAEMERRSGLAVSAHTRADLDVALDDLPVPAPPPRPTPLDLIARLTRITNLVSSAMGVVVAVVILAVFVVTFLRLQG